MTMNAQELAKALRPTARFDSTRYPTAYAIDYALLDSRRWSRVSGIPIPETGHDARRRTEAMRAIEAFARRENIAEAEVFTALADEYIIVANIQF